MMRGIIKANLSTGNRRPITGRWSIIRLPIADLRWKIDARVFCQALPIGSPQSPIINLGLSMPPIYPFTAIVGQERMLRALVLNAVNPRIGGVLIRGERGTAKSTAARALAGLLPEVRVVVDC